MAGSLKDRLDSDWQHALVGIHKAVVQIWTRPLHRYYTDHSVTHSERIIKLLDGLTAGVMESSQALSPTEIFILLASAYLHDIGMQNEKFASGDLEYIRDHHHEQTGEMIYNVFEQPDAAFPIPIERDPDLIEAIVVVSKGHRKTDLYDTAYNSFAYRESVIRPQLLAALLRFADELDIDHRRVNMELMKIVNLSVESKLHWWKCYYVSGVHIENENIRIWYRIPFERPDYESLVVPLVEMEIRTKLLSLQSIFRFHAVKVDLLPSGIHSSRVIQLMPDDVEGLARKKLGISYPAAFHNSAAQIGLKAANEADKPLVLIVDDEPKWRDILVNLLKSEFTVIAADTYTRALEMFLKQDPPFHVIIADIWLDQNKSHHQGLDFLDTLRKKMMYTKSIVITGDATVPTVRRAFRDLNVFEYVEKVPASGDDFDPAGFRQIVRKAAYAAMQQQAASIVRGSMQMVEVQPSENKEVLEITLSMEYDKWDHESHEAAIRTLADIMGVLPDVIRVVRFVRGSVILWIEVPKRAADRLMTFYEAENPKLKEIGITSVSRNPSAKPESIKPGSGSQANDPGSVGKTPDSDTRQVRSSRSQHADQPAAKPSSELRANTIDLSVEDRERLAYKLNMFPDWRDGGMLGKKGILAASGLPLDYLDRLLWTGSSSTDTQMVISNLQDLGHLANRPSHRALGALVEHLLDETPHIEGKLFLAYLIERYQLIRDQNYMDSLLQDYALIKTQASDALIDLGWKRDTPPFSWHGPRDQRELERIWSKRAPFLDAVFMEHGSRVARAVCRIEQIDKTPLGTGFLIGPKLVLTNHHVVQTDDEAAEIQVRFGYRFDDSGQLQAGQTYRIIRSLKRSPETDLDYVLLEVEGAAGDDPAIGYLRPVERKLRRDSPAYIIQHPEGDPQKVVLQDNLITYVSRDHRRVQYLTNTEYGSSGAPVCNEKWEVIALHHSRSPLPESLRTLFIRGNEGIPMVAILPEIHEFLT